MPLTTITAWEALFDRLSLSEDISKKTMASRLSNDSIINITKKKKHYLLIIGGAGGVGSITIQLAKQVAELPILLLLLQLPQETNQWNGVIKWAPTTS